MAVLPKSIRVGYRSYRVEPWAAREASATSRWGECDRMNLVIRIRDDLVAQVQAEVLMHEVIHAAYSNAALQKDDDEERLVEALGNQLTQVWRDNPDLVAFMSASLAGR